MLSIPTLFRIRVWAFAIGLLVSTAMVIPVPARATGISRSENEGVSVNRNGVRGRIIASIPFEISNNQIALRVSVNGSKPLIFLLDTGTNACVVDFQQARAMKLELEGSGLARGEGDGTQEVKFARGVKLELSGLTISVPRLAVMKLRPMGRKYSGLLGYDFFARYVVEVDYEARIVNVYEPEGFDFYGRGETVAVTIEHGLPFVSASLTMAGHGAVQRRLLLDTGSSESVNDPIVELSQPYVRVVGTGAVGENFVTHLGRIDQVAFGGFVFRDVLGISGGIPLIGGDVLHRFNAIFDYSRSRVILRPNRHVDEPFILDQRYEGKIPRFRNYPYSRLSVR